MNSFMGYFPYVGILMSKRRFISLEKDVYFIWWYQHDDQTVSHSCKINIFKNIDKIERFVK